VVVVVGAVVVVAVGVVAASVVVGVAAVVVAGFVAGFGASGGSGLAPTSAYPIWISLPAGSPPWSAVRWVSAAVTGPRQAPAHGVVPRGTLSRLKLSGPQWASGNVALGTAGIGTGAPSACRFWAVVPSKLPSVLATAAVADARARIVSAVISPPKSTSPFT